MPRPAIIAMRAGPSGGAPRQAGGPTLRAIRASAAIAVALLLAAASAASAETRPDEFVSPLAAAPPAPPPAPPPASPSASPPTSPSTAPPAPAAAPVPQAAPAAAPPAMPARAPGSAPPAASAPAASSPAASPPAAAAAPAALPVATLRAGSHPAFGRVVIDLPPGASATATTEGGMVHLRVAGATLGGTFHPPRNITAITTRDGEAELTLVPGAHIKVSRFGARFVVDVYVDSLSPAEASPPAATTAPAEAPAGAPMVVAAASPTPAPGRPPGFSGPPPRSGPLPAVPPPPGADVAGAAPAPATAAPPNATLATAASPADAAVPPSEAATADAPEHVRVPLQRLLDGNLPDVLRQTPARPPQAGAPAPASVAPAPVPQAAPSPAVPSPAGPSPAATSGAAAPMAAAPSAPPAAAALSPRPLAAAATTVVKPPATGPRTAPVTEVRRAALPAPGSAEMPRPAPAIMAAAAGQTGGEASGQAAVAGPVAISARSDGPTLILPFLSTTGAAAFRRGDTAVVVFDEARPIDLSTLSDDPRVAAAFGDARIQLLPSATILRVSLPADAGLRLARREEGWSLTRLPRPPPLAPIRGDVVDGSMRLEAAAPGSVVSVPDPDTGGALLVGTQTERGQGVPVSRRTPGFTLLETMQGVAVDPNSDSLTLRVAPGKEFAGFLLTTEGQAAVGRPEAESGRGAASQAPPPPAPAAATAAADGAAPAAPAVQADARPPPLTETGRGVELDPLGPDAIAALDAAHMTRRWDLPALSTEALLRRLQAATDAAAAAPPRGRTAARLAALQAQLALGMGAEADSLANVIVADDARASDSPDVIGLKAVAAMLAGRLSEADGIDSPTLDGTDEVNFWRAARKAMTREGAPDAAAAFSATMPLLLSYPEALRARLEPLAAETMVLGGEPEAARRLLEAHKDDTRLDLARAMLAERSGHTAQALAILDRLARSPDRLLRARASVRAVEARLRAGLLSNASAADALDRLIYAWRGDRRELAVRLREAELRDASGNWRAALALLRETGDGELGQTWADALPDIHARMSSVFAHALESDAKRALPPLQLVALVEENPDLLPDGEAGRAVAARLADRLVALDLPDRAVPVLEKLMNATPEGPARSEIGLRLAAVRLDRHDAAGALEALSASTASTLPASVDEARTIIFARATAARGDLPAATAALAAMDTPAADEARASLLEQVKDWRGAVLALTSYAEKIVPADGPLADGPANVVLRLASAAARAGDEALLARLRERELARMPAGKLADMFRILTERPVRGVSDLPRAAREAALARAMPAELQAPRPVAAKP